MALDRPVLVTGTPRSGKTCVWNILRQAGEFCAVEEPIMIWSACGGRWPDDCRPAWAATEKVKRRIARRCSELVRRQGKRRYLDNLSHHALRIPFVHAVMPDVRLVHVIRSAEEAVPEISFGWTKRISIAAVIRLRRRNVDLRVLPGLVWRFARNYVRRGIYGSRETWGPVVPGLAEFKPGHEVEEVAAYQWAKMVEIALDGIRATPGLRVLEMRFEHLAANPRAEARRLAEFAEVEHPGALVEFAARYVKNDRTPWKHLRREHRQEEWRAIRSIVAPVQRRLRHARAA